MVDLDAIRQENDFVNWRPFRFELRRRELEQEIRLPFDRLDQLPHSLSQPPRASRRSGEAIRRNYTKLLSVSARRKIDHGLDGDTSFLAAIEQVDAIIEVCGGINNVSLTSFIDNARGGGGVSGCPSHCTQ